MRNERCTDWAQDLILPTILFAALGAMGWAVRGCSGFGAMNGCLFAGVLWGAAWWFVARDPSGLCPRPYASGWVVLALTVGLAIAGNRGWMQWPSFFAGHLQTNTARGEFVPIARFHGFVWLFIAGVPWAGLGACFLAWCGPRARPHWTDWVGRILAGVAGAFLGRFLFNALPEVFLPLYKSLQSQYADLPANPNLRRLINDNRAALTHLGLYLGFLSFEMGKRSWRNSLLIVTVGVLNGLGWALCQNWQWAASFWSGSKFNWWRCWESSGGLCIGLAYGVAYYAVNRPAQSAADVRSKRVVRSYPNLERAACLLALVLGLGLSIRNGLKGWANIYLGNERYWDGVLWRVFGPLLVVAVLAVVVRIWSRPVPPGWTGDLFPQAYRLIWVVLIVQNTLAQLVTGPWTVWDEVVFACYYVLLFLLTAVIVQHFHWIQQHAKRLA